MTDNPAHGQPEDSPIEDAMPGTDPPSPKPPREHRPRVFGRYAFWIVVFPFIFYLMGTMVGGYLETIRIAFIKGELHQQHDADQARLETDEEVDISEIEIDPEAKFLFGLLPLGKNSYPYTYTFTIVVTTLLMLLFGWGYFRAPFKVSFLAIIVGVVGIVVWIGLSWLDQNVLHLGEMLSSGRTSFNPFEELKDNRTWMWQFLCIRFFGLVLVVPIIEEFFVRGFLMRYVDDPDWDEIPLGEAKKAGWISPTVYGVIAHLTEPLAALVWFTMVSWLYKKTGSVWDCVVAHAVTNLLLGIYVVQFEAWHLW